MHFHSVQLILTDSWDRDHARNYIDYIDSTFTR